LSQLVLFLYIGLIILVGVLELDEKSIQPTKYTEQELAVVQSVVQLLKHGMSRQGWLEGRNRVFAQVSRDAIVKWINEGTESDEKDAKFIPRVIEQLKRPDITEKDVQLISQEMHKFSARSVTPLPEFVTKLAQMLR